LFDSHRGRSLPSQWCDGSFDCRLHLTIAASVAAWASTPGCRSCTRNWTLASTSLGGDGVGRYGSSQLSDVTARPNGTLALIRGGQALGTLEFHPSPKLDVYMNAGWEMPSVPLISTQPAPAALAMARSSSTTLVATWKATFSDEPEYSGSQVALAMAM